MRRVPPISVFGDVSVSYKVLARGDRLYIGKCDAISPKLCKEYNKWRKKEGVELLKGYISIDWLLGPGTDNETGEDAGIEQGFKDELARIAESNTHLLPVVGEDGAHRVNLDVLFAFIKDNIARDRRLWWTRYPSPLWPTDGDDALVPAPVAQVIIDLSLAHYEAEEYAWMCELYDVAPIVRRMSVPVEGGTRQFLFCSSSLVALELRPATPKGQVAPGAEEAGAEAGADKAEADKAGAKEAGAPGQDGPWPLIEDEASFAPGAWEARPFGARSEWAPLQEAVASVKNPAFTACITKHAKSGQFELWPLEPGQPLSAAEEKATRQAASRRWAADNLRDRVTGLTDPSLGTLARADRAKTEKAARGDSKRPSKKRDKAKSGAKSRDTEEDDIEDDDTEVDEEEEEGESSDAPAPRKKARRRRSPESRRESSPVPASGVMLKRLLCINGVTQASMKRVVPALGQCRPLEVSMKRPTYFAIFSTEEDLLKAMEAIGALGVEGLVLTRVFIEQIRV